PGSCRLRAVSPLATRPAANVEYDAVSSQRSESPTDALDRLVTRLAGQRQLQDPGPAMTEGVRGERLGDIRRESVDHLEHGVVVDGEDASMHDEIAQGAPIIPRSHPAALAMRRGRTSDLRR